MKRRFPWFVAALILTLLVPSLTLAGKGQEKDKYRWKTWRTPRSHAGFDGHGGFFIGFQMLEFDGLKELAREMHIQVPKDGIFGAGGYGLGHVGGGWRLGGGGYGYHRRYSGIYVDDSDPAHPKEFNRVMDVEIGGGGFIVEYSPWMIGPVNFGLGAWIGGGGIVIRLHQDDGTFTWDDLSHQYTGNPTDPESLNDNIVTEAERGYFLLQPYFTMRVHVLDWMAFEGTTGFNWNTATNSGWKFGDREIAGNGPEIKTKHLYVRFGMVFGG